MCCCSVLYLAAGTGPVQKAHSSMGFPQAFFPEPRRLRSCSAFSLVPPCQPGSWCVCCHISIAAAPQHTQWLVLRTRLPFGRQAQQRGGRLLEVTGGHRSAQKAFGTAAGERVEAGGAATLLHVPGARI